MTVKQLKEILKDIPDTHDVCFEYDGTETYTMIDARAIEIHGNYILFVEKEFPIEVKDHE